MDINSLLQSLDTIRKQIAVLEKSEKSVLNQIKPIVDPDFNSLPAPKKGESYPSLFFGGELGLARTPTVHRSISADLLLERGVSPDVINYATKTTNSFQYRIKTKKGD